MKSGCDTLVVKVTYSWLAYHEFEPSTAEILSCRGAMNVKSESSKRPLIGVVVRRWEVQAQVSSSSLDYGSKLRGPSPKALV
ncbi:hypothetical protein TNCV_4682641 [Trichonephila clavipes]|nr:hypothetical protein TNCV_4682641 [Trichonephila clavipes]